MNSQPGARLEIPVLVAYAQISPFKAHVGWRIQQRWGLNFGRISFFYIHTLCLEVAKARTSLCIQCTDSPEPALRENDIRTKITYVGLCTLF